MRLLSHRYPHAVVITAGVCAALHVGKLAPALTALQDALGVTLLQAGFLLSLVQLAGMLLGLVVGAAADGLGLRRSMVTGLLLLSAAGAMGGWAHTPAPLLALRALEGMGFLLVVLPAPGLIRQLAAPDRVSTMLGYWGAYMPLGTALALLAGPFVLHLADWRVWWWLLAGASFVMAWCLWVSAPDGPPAGTMPLSGSMPAPHAAHPLHGWLLRVSGTLRARGPWLLALSFAVYSAQWLAIIGFLPVMVASYGSPGLAVAPLLALVALVNMGGNVASGRLLQRGVPAHVLLYAGYGVMAGGALVAFAQVPGVSDSGVWLLARYAGVVCFSLVGGLVPGTLFSLAGVLAPDQASISTTVGWMQQWSSAGQLFGPPLVAGVAGVAGGWQWTWVVTCTFSLAGLFLARKIALEVAR